MYWPLFLVVFLVWLLIAGGAVSAWRDGKLPAWASVGTVLAWTGVAVCVILVGGPYWRVIYQMLLQPG